MYFPMYMSHRGGQLPEVLSYEDEMKFVEAWDKGDTQAGNMLIVHNLRLVAHIAKKYTNIEDSEELISIGTMGLIKAVNTYKSHKGKLATYASRCIENEILMYLRKEKKHRNDVSLQESAGVDKEGNEVSLEEKIADDGRSIEETTALKITIERLYSLIESRLTKREKDIIAMRYGLFGQREMTQREIAKGLGISRSYVSRIETKALNKLKDV